MSSTDADLRWWQDRGWWSRRVAGLPLGLALSMVTAVWLAGAAWNFEEQDAAAASLQFHLPMLLPLVLDGFAVALAAVAWAAALDGRAAVGARCGTVLAIGMSSACSGWWGWSRSAGDVPTVVIAAGVPVVALVSFEVLLSEIRRRVHRRRGLPAPMAIAWPRLVELLLAPWPTFRDWRAQVLTDLRDARTARPVVVSEAPSARTVGAVDDEVLLAIVRPLVMAGKGRPTVVAALKECGHSIGSSRAGRLMAAAGAPTAEPEDDVDDDPASLQQDGAA